MSAGVQDGDTLIRNAAAAAERAGQALGESLEKAEARVSVEAGEALPAFLGEVEAPVEFALLPRRMESVPAGWRAVFLPLSILQAEGKVNAPRGAGKQPWDASLSLVEKLKVKAAGGGLAAARKELLASGGRALWWLPARINLLAAGDAAPESFRRDWERMREMQADLSAQDSALAGLAADPSRRGPFDLGEPTGLMERQGGEGNWSLAPFAGQVISTAFALDHMQKRGVDEREAAVLRAGEWLRSVQNADGGWGESGELAAGEAPSSAVKTACAVAGLVAGGDAGSESVRRGIDYLVRTQGEDGTWRDDGYNWALLPGLVECRSTLDALTLPLWALNAFLKHSEAGGAGSRRVY